MYVITYGLLIAKSGLHVGPFPTVFVFQLSYSVTVCPIADTHNKAKVAATKKPIDLIDVTPFFVIYLRYEISFPVGHSLEQMTSSTTIEDNQMQHENLIVRNLIVNSLNKNKFFIIILALIAPVVLIQSGDTITETNPHF